MYFRLLYVRVIVHLLSSRPVSSSCVPVSDAQIETEKSRPGEVDACSNSSRTQSLVRSRVGAASVATIVNNLSFLVRIQLREAAFYALFSRRGLSSPPGCCCVFCCCFLFYILTIVLSDQLSQHLPDGSSRQICAVNRATAVSGWNLFFDPSRDVAMATNLLALSTEFSFGDIRWMALAHGKKSSWFAWLRLTI